MDDISNNVKFIVGRHLGHEDRKLTGTENIFDDLGADQLDELEILMTLEDEYVVEFPDRDYKTVNDFIQVVQETCKG